MKFNAKFNFFLNRRLIIGKSFIEQTSQNKHFWLTDFPDGNKT